MGELAVADDPRDGLGSDDVADKHGVYLNTPLAAVVFQECVEFFLKESSAFTYDEFCGLFFASFDAGESADRGKDYFIEDIFHVSDDLGEARSKFFVDIEFDCSLDSNGKSINGEESYRLFAAEFMSLPSGVDHGDRVDEGVYAVSTLFEHLFDDSFSSIGNEETLL